MVRKVLIPDDCFRKIEEDRDRWRAKGLETGGWLLGKLHSNGLAVVTQVLYGGPRAERSPASFTGDNEYATKVKEELRREDPEIRLLGEYHVHPWKGPANLSGGDIGQLEESKKTRPWFIVLLWTEDDFKIWDAKLEVEGGSWLCGEWVKENGVSYHACRCFPQRVKTDLKEVQHQIIHLEVATEEKFLERILKITSHELLMEKTVLIVGLGSGGSVVAKYLGCTGVGRIILVDNEALEIPNIIRHEGSVEDIGKSKVAICKRIIELHNPFTVVETYGLDATKDTEKLESLISEADLLVCSTGNPKINNILNKFSVERRLPAIYGGIYEKASGGYVLAVKPYETACFNCLFDITSRSYSVDTEVAQRYGLSEEELHQQQGLWIDISFPSLMLSKIALAFLEGKKLDYNLALYDSSMEIKKLSVVRRDDCAVCNQEGWLRKQEQPSAEKRTSFAQRLRRKFRWRV